MKFTSLQRAHRIMELLEHYGFEARIVGGAVRDLCMNRTPKDIDIATTATPEIVGGIFHQEGYKVIETGLQHGTLTVPFDDENFEITTLRIDQETDGRHASVVFTDDWVADAARRDFTVNAMSMDRFGKIYDYFGGQGDLKEGKIRFVGDASARIGEDYLRILRYVRFCGRYGIDWNAFADFGAIKLGIPGLIKNVSKERIRDEILKITLESENTEIFRLMNFLGLSDAIFGKHLRVLRYREIEDPVLKLNRMGVDLEWFISHKFSWRQLSYLMECNSLHLDMLEHNSRKYVYWKYGHNMYKLAWNLFHDSMPLPDYACFPPKRPFSGDDVKRAYPELTGKEIGDKLLELTLKWCNSGYKECVI